jgi:hypothetical protein
MEGAEGGAMRQHAPGGLKQRGADGLELREPACAARALSAAATARPQLKKVVQGPQPSCRWRGGTIQDEQETPIDFHIEPHRTIGEPGTTRRIHACGEGWPVSVVGFDAQPCTISQRAGHLARARVGTRGGPVGRPGPSGVKRSGAIVVACTIFINDVATTGQSLRNPCLLCCIVGEQCTAMAVCIRSSALLVLTGVDTTWHAVLFARGAPLTGNEANETNMSAHVSSKVCNTVPKALCVTVRVA